MIRSSPSASSAVLCERFDRPFAVSRTSMLDRSESDPRLVVSAHRQRSGARFEPYLNYSRSRDALTLRVHGHPPFRDSCPLFTAKQAFEPHSNYSRFRDARQNARLHLPSRLSIFRFPSAALAKQKETPSLAPLLSTCLRVYLFTCLHVYLLTCLLIRRSALADLRPLR